MASGNGKGSSARSGSNSHSHCNSNGRGRRSGPLSFLASIYDLDTLDTRFTTPSSVPYRAAADAPVKPDPRAEPSKWATPEFYLYYLVFVTVVPYMFWVAYDVSRRRFFLL